MRPDSEVKMLGLEKLNENLGIVDAERFVSLIQRERFDCTKWRENLFEGLSGREISKKAIEFQKGNRKGNKSYFQTRL
jgi:hypothetical protein